MQGLTFVNEYALVTTLGRGSFGEVKLALNTNDMEVYALKLIAKTKRKQPASTSSSNSSTHVAEASVMSEINVMKELSHPNLVRLVEVIGTSLRIYSHPRIFSTGGLNVALVTYTFCLASGAA